jgi:hypothetical protein
MNVRCRLAPRCAGPPADAFIFGSHLVGGCVTLNVWREKAPTRSPIVSARIVYHSCGQLTTTVAEDPVRVSLSHRLAYQRRTGSVFGAQAGFNKKSVTIHGTCRQYVRIGDEGTRTTFRFCPPCGATGYYKAEDREDSRDISVGAFGEPRFPRQPSRSTKNAKHAWVGLPPDIKHVT